MPSSRSSLSANRQIRLSGVSSKNQRLGEIVSNAKEKLLLIGSWIRFLWLFTVGCVAIVYLVQKGFSAEYFTLAVAVLASWSLYYCRPGLSKSKIFSEAVMTIFYAVVFVSAWLHDTSYGFFPMMWGIVFFFSTYTLFVTVRERNSPEAN